MKKLLTHPAAAGLLRRAGVDPAQYSLLLDLFSKLSSREEFEVGGSMYSLKIMVGMFAVISGLINLIVAFGPRTPLQAYILANFVFTALLVVMILTMEALNTFLNPVEASVLAHQPIRDGSYFAAKLTHLAVVVAYVVFPVNTVPAIAGLNLRDASWLHPVTYLASAYLMGLFIALAGCGMLGFLFRLLPLPRVRNTVLWLQIGFFLAIGIGPTLMRAIGAAGRGYGFAGSSAFPLNWFAALASPGARPVRMFLTWPAALSLAVSGILIIFGIRALSKDYLGRVHGLLRSGPARRRARSGLPGRAVRILTGKPSGHAAFAFVYGMARTDWQFRRTVYPMLLQLLIVAGLGLARSRLGHSPFEPGFPTAAQFLPHLSGILGLTICFALPYSNQHRAAWVFLTFPMDGIRTFVRGIFWSAWMSVTALPVALMPLLAWYWGVLDAGLFTAYSIAAGSLYLSLELFMLEGLPFSNPPESMKGSMTAPLVVAGMLVALVLVGLQWLFIFQSRLTAAGAALVFGGAAYLIARISLRYLETSVLHNLHRIGSGRAAMFKQL